MAQKQSMMTPAKLLWGPIPIDPTPLSPGTSSISDLAFGTTGAALLKNMYSKSAVIVTLADLELKMGCIERENDMLRQDHMMLRKEYQEMMTMYSSEMEILKVRVIASELRGSGQKRKM